MTTVERKSSTTSAQKEAKPTRLVDGAIILALSIGYLYLLGSTNNIQAEGEIPSAAFPSPSPNDFLVRGGFIAIFSLCIVALPFLLYVFMRRVAFTKVMCLMILGCFLLCSLAIAAFIRFPTYKDSIIMFPRVLVLETTNNTRLEQEKWRYISQKDGILFFGNTENKNIMMIQASHIVRIVTEPY